MGLKFFQACTVGDLATVLDLLPQVDLSQDLGILSMRQATIEGHLEIFNSLLADGRIIPSSSSVSILSLACSYGQLEIATKLLQNPKREPPSSFTDALIVACQRGHEKMAQLLLQQPETDPKDQHNMAFKVAIANGHDGIVELLLKDGRAFVDVVDIFVSNQVLRNMLNGLLPLILQNCINDIPYCSSMELSLFNNRQLDIMLCKGFGWKNLALVNEILNMRYRRLQLNEHTFPYSCFKDFFIKHRYWLTADIEKGIRDYKRAILLLQNMPLSEAEGRNNILAQDIPFVIFSEAKVCVSRPYLAGSRHLL